MGVRKGIHIASDIGFKMSQKAHQRLLNKYYGSKNNSDRIKYCYHRAVIYEQDKIRNVLTQHERKNVFNTQKFIFELNSGGR